MLRRPESKNFKIDSMTVFVTQDEIWNEGALAKVNHFARTRKRPRGLQLSPVLYKLFHHRIFILLFVHVMRTQTLLLAVHLKVSARRILLCLRNLRTHVPALAEQERRKKHSHLHAVFLRAMKHRDRPIKTNLVAFRRTARDGVNQAISFDSIEQLAVIFSRLRLDIQLHLYAVIEQRLSLRQIEKV